MKTLIKSALLLLLFSILSCSSDDDQITQIDTDGDGIFDHIEIENGTDKNNACDPQQNEGYTGYDTTNTIWKNSNCDDDSVLNGDEVTNGTDPYFDNTAYAIPELLPKLSELN
jgi:hypothetical protein